MNDYKQQQYMTNYLCQWSHAIYGPENYHHFHIKWHLWQWQLHQSWSPTREAMLCKVLRGILVIVTQYILNNYNDNYNNYYYATSNSYSVHVSAATVITWQRKMDSTMSST